jgi:hypothetical protein
MNAVTELDDNVLLILTRVPVSSSIDRVLTGPFQPEPEGGTTAASAFHLHGKHDQKTHGSGGTSWPGDWGGVSLEEARALTYQHYQQMFKVLNLGSDPDRPAIDKATTGYTFYQSGDNLVGIHADADINDTDTAKLMENVDTLSERFPVPGGVNVMVDTIDAMNPSDWRKIDGGMDPNLAETVKATGMMRFSDMGLNGGAESHLTELYRGDQATSLIAHEWGHTQDTIDTFASRQVKKDLRAAGVGNSSRYALVGGPDEAFAEAFADFNTTPSGGTYAWSSTQAYVDTYGWK